jgi:bacterioferritin
MRGDPKIIEALNDVLTAELTAINQYIIHSKMCENWGYKKLQKKKREFALDGVPNMQRLNPVRVGETATEQHELDLDVEVSAIDRLNKGIALCRDKADNGTRELLEGILKGEERHADWLEAQLHLIDEVGKEQYLAEQISE